VRLGVAVAALLVFGASPASAQDAPPLPTLPHSAEIQLKVERDGALSVVEAISVPSDATMTRRIPLRSASAHNRDRILGVRDVVIEGAGTSELTADEFTVKLRGGTSIVRYTVDGAVNAGDGVVDVSWQLAGGWDTDLELVRASFAAPRIPDAVSCLAGPPGSDLRCGAAQIDHSGLTRFNQRNLPAGQRMDIGVELPAGAVPANARLEPSKTLAGAFVVTAPIKWAWGGFVLVLAGAAVVLWWLRRRDSRPGEALPDSARPGTDAPDGVLPGHVGCVLSGRADAVDLAATVLDLAVRGYLSVDEEPGDDGIADWRLVRCNPPDEQLSAFEVAVLAMLLPDGTESVRLSELRAARLGIARLRGELFDDLVGRRWFSQRAKLAGFGVRLCFYGAFLTVLLVLTVGFAQLGVIVIAAGVVLAAGARAVPARTTRGVLLRRRLLGLRERLADEKGVDDQLFSRALPFALALGVSENQVGSSGETSPNWYRARTGFARPGDFTAALVGTFAGSREGRRLRA
jgi:hypothetical protein